MHPHLPHYIGPHAVAALASGAVATLAWTYTGVRAVLGGISITQVNSGAAALIAALGTLIMGGLQLYTLVRTKQRELSRKDFDESLERKQLLDQANKESLSAQLGEMQEQRAEDRKKAETEAAESRGNQERMRQTLHAITSELQARTFENNELRDDLHAANASLKEVNQGFLAVSKDLAEARKLNAELNVEIVRLRGEVERLNRTEEERLRSVRRVEAKLDQALGQSDSGNYPAVQLPPAAAPEGPAL